MLGIFEADYHDPEVSLSHPYVRSIKVHHNSCAWLKLLEELLEIVGSYETCKNSTTQCSTYSNHQLILVEKWFYVYKCLSITIVLKLRLAAVNFSIKSIKLITFFFRMCPCVLCVFVYMCMTVCVGV